MDQWTSSGEKSSTLQYGLHIDQTGSLLSISPQHFAQNRKVNNSPLHNVWAVSTALASGHPPVDKPTPLFSSQRLRPSRAFPLTDLSTIGSGDCRPRNAGICFKRRFGQIEAEENQNRQRFGSVMESWNKFAWKQKEASIIFIAEEAETSWTVSQPSSPIMFAGYWLLVRKVCDVHSLWPRCTVRLKYCTMGVLVLALTCARQCHSWKKRLSGGVQCF